MKRTTILFAFLLILSALSGCSDDDAAVSFTVTFDKNDSAATGTMEPQTITNSITTLSTNQFQNSGYLFAGWATNSNGSVVYSDGQSITTGNENLTLYAKWGFQVTYFGTTTNQIIAAENSLLTKPADPQKDGYFFAGWYTEAALNTRWDFSSDTVTAATGLYPGWASYSNSQPAVGVIGQADLTNSTSGCTESKFTDPYSLEIDQTTGKVFVADYANNRILRFASLRGVYSNASAEAVIGQPDMTTSTMSMGQNNRLSSPQQIFLDGSGNLWVADNGNNRILRFPNALTCSSGPEADLVLGQSNMSVYAANRGGAASAATLYYPTGVGMDSAGNLIVADYNNHRVLIYKNASTLTNGAPADLVLGQSNMTSVSPNRDGNLMTATTNLAANTFNNPYRIFVDNSDRLFVADYMNYRVLVFNGATTLTDGQDADLVLGQADMTGLADQNTPDATQTGYPRGLAMDKFGTLYVVDGYHHRILGFKSSSIVNGHAADLVLGQPDFVTATAYTAPTASTVKFPRDIAIDNQTGRFYTISSGWDRMLIFEPVLIKD